MSSLCISEEISHLFVDGFCLYSGSLCTVFAFSGHHVHCFEEHVASLCGCFMYVGFLLIGIIIVKLCLFTIILFCFSVDCLAFLQ